MQYTEKPSLFSSHLWSLDISPPRLSSLYQSPLSSYLHYRNDRQGKRHYVPYPNYCPHTRDNSAWCNVNLSPTAVSPNVCSWMMRSLDGVSLHDPSLGGEGGGGLRLCRVRWALKLGFPRMTHRAQVTQRNQKFLRVVVVIIHRPAFRSRFGTHRSGTLRPRDILCLTIMKGKTLGDTSPWHPPHEASLQILWKGLNVGDLKIGDATSRHQSCWTVPVLFRGYVFPSSCCFWTDWLVWGSIVNMRIGLLTTRSLWVPLTCTSETEFLVVIETKVLRVFLLACS